MFVSDSLSWAMEFQTDAQLGELGDNGRRKGGSFTPWWHSGCNSPQSSGKILGLLAVNIFKASIFFSFSSLFHPLPPS